MTDPKETAKAIYAEPFLEQPDRYLRDSPRTTRTIPARIDGEWITRRRRANANLMECSNDKLIRSRLSESWPAVGLPRPFDWDRTNNCGGRPYPLGAYIFGGPALPDGALTSHTLKIGKTPWPMRRPIQS